MNTTIFKSIGMLLTALGFPFMTLSQNQNSNNMEKKTINMTITYTIGSPLKKVWDAWSNAESIKNWWGPEGFTAPVANVNFKEGGVTLVCMRSPEGFDIYNSWTYKKIVPMQNLEFAQHFTDKNGNKLNPADIGLPPGIPYEVPHTILFRDLGKGQTEITITEYGYANAETAEISKAGMKSVLNKLAKLLST
jgi:uncharacterized protein YndB with AHSA1/START domain